MAPKKDKGKGKGKAVPDPKGAAKKAPRRTRRDTGGPSGIAPAERAALPSSGEVFPARARRPRASDPPPPRLHKLIALPWFASAIRTDQPRPHHAAASSSDSEGGAGREGDGPAPARTKSSRSGPPKTGRHTFTTLTDMWIRNNIQWPPTPYQRARYDDRAADITNLSRHGTGLIIDDIFDLSSFAPVIDEPGREASPRHTRGRSSSSSSSGSEGGRSSAGRQARARLAKVRVARRTNRRRPSRR